MGKLIIEVFSIYKESTELYEVLLAMPVHHEDEQHVALKENK
jgi:hypothetical protein